ncbi:hypothetical protein K503DRAFT_869020 [Rhizopogon vinicolor AM-OR11-026]|uniref:Uncharacterized protein n=1 Tax=Rhizopogon vinicolor AM-OR11-026 TaxID=1314800 RepID=A0A1B7MNW5_9AGAM|nr:hypothetical protein K503DRAFT_869020 [Rhizopogon vinicolor AM-OR11-026]
MSPRLSELFENLQILDSDRSAFIRRGQDPFKFARPAPQPRVQFYGYALPPKWLVKFAEQNCPELLPNRNDRKYDLISAARGFEVLQGWLCISSLDRQCCFNPKWRNSVPPEWFESVYQEDAPEDLETVAVLTVCSDREYEFKRRPTQVQLDFLTRLFGKAPKWWVSCDWEE